jgi:CheY-like chemotaxis protein
MTFPEPPQARLLVVEEEPFLRDVLVSIFLTEGYLARGVSSLEEALRGVEHQSYDLILADLIAGVSKHSFTPAHLLRRRALATPIGLLTTQPKLLAAPHYAGFAFALPRPVDVSWLLTEVAACLQPIPGPEHSPHTQIIKRLLEAWSLQEWKSLLDLCTDDMLCYPPSLFLHPSASPLQGKLAFLKLMTSLRGRYQSMRVEIQGVYGRPHGLAVHAHHWVARVGKDWDTFLGTALFAFAGERICQIGIPLSLRQRHALLELPGTLGGEAHSC